MSLLCNSAEHSDFFKNTAATELAVLPNELHTPGRKSRIKVSKKEKEKRAKIARSSSLTEEIMSPNLFYLPLHTHNHT